MLDKAKINSNGEVFLKFSINQPYFTLINLGNSNQVIYVKPDAKYEILLDFSKKYFGIKV